METPQSISVITSDQMQAQQAESISEAMRYSVGAISENYGADPRADWIKLRGFQVPDFLDGLPMPRATYAWALTNPYMLERVEILRGPASALYGKSPPGGLVNMVSKRPTDTPVREVQLQAGYPTSGQAAIDLGGRIDEDGRLSYRLVALGRKGDTQVDEVNDDGFMIAPSLKWKLSADTELTLLAHYIKNDTKSLQFLPAQGTLMANPNGRISRDTFLGNTDWDDHTHEQYGIGYSFEHRFNDNTTFRQNLRQAQVDYDLQVVRGFGFPAGELRYVNTRPVVIQDRVRSFNVDNQLEHKFETGAVRHTVLAGLDYQRQHADYNFGVGTMRGVDIYNPVNTPIGPITTRTSSEQDMTQLGVYAQEQAQIGNLTLLLSGRHDRVQFDSLNRLSGINSDLDTDANTGRIGAIYNFDNGIAPYMSYATSFEPNLGVDYTGDPMDPTTGKQFEMGVKYQPESWGNSLITLAAYDLWQDDIVSYDSVLGGSRQFGKAHVQGLELEGKASLTDGLDITAAVAYMRSDVRKSVTPDEVGNELPLTPRRTASVWANYTFKQGAWDGLSAGAGVRYIGKSYADAANSFTIPSVTLMDLALRYELGKLNPALGDTTLALNVANVADREFVAGCNDMSSCYWGSGRTVRLTLTHQF